MKAFYSIVLIIGIVGILIGIRAVYVGQDKIRNAESYAQLSYTVSSIQSMTNEIASGHFSDRSDSYEKLRELRGTQRLEKRYKESGQTSIIIGVVFLIGGLLLALFGRAKYRELGSSTDMKSEPNE